MINFAKTKPYFEHPDQDIINSVLKGRIKMLDLWWNNQWKIDKRYIMIFCYRKGIYHYTYRIKPWNLVPHNNRFKREYIRTWNTSWLALFQLYYIPKAMYSLYCQFSKLEAHKIKREIKFKITGSYD